MRTMFFPAVLACATLVSACGIKGPLYDPHTQPPHISSVPTGKTAEGDHNKPVLLARLAE